MRSTNRNPTSDGRSARAAAAGKITLPVGVAIGVVALAAVLWIALGSPERAGGPPGVPSGPFEIKVTPPEAEIVLDEQPPARGTLVVKLPLPAGHHLLTVSAPGYVRRVIAFNDLDHLPGIVTLDPDRSAPPPPHD